MGTRPKRGTPGGPPDLRRRAEALLDARGEQGPADLSAEEVTALLHDLHTHQIELEMQNEELRRAQQELLESRDRLSDLYDFAPVGYLTLSAKGLVLDANLTLAEMLGVERGRLLRQPFSAFILPEDQDIYYLHMKERRAVPGKRSCELRLRRDHAPPLWVRVDGVPVTGARGEAGHLRAAVSDISDRKRAEETVDRFRDLLEQASEAIFLVDPGTGAFLHVNAAAAASLGYTPAEMLDLRVSDIDAELPSPEMWSAHVKEVSARGSVLFEGVHRRRDGCTFPVEVGVRYLARGERGYLIAVARDISQRKAAERQQARLEAHLRQSQKMEAIGTLSGGIAHDFNNVLGIILGNTELAAFDVPDWNPAQHNLDEIKKATLRARDMVRQILAFSRQEEPSRKPVAVGPLVRETLQLLRATIPTTVAIKQEIQSETDCVMADPSQLNQVLMNLCTNAAHAMRDRGGVLSVALQRRSLGQDAPGRHPDLTPADWLVMTVSDTGPGIAPHILERVFDPYFTTKGPGEGTGMGLSVAHGIVRKHGGAILARSEPGRGSTFEVFLPLLDTAAMPGEEPRPAPLPTGHERVLLVDDEESLASLGKRMLEQLGYGVTPTTGSLEALELFREQPDRFDLVITDMTMPHMTGSELSLEILRIRPDIPVILCTGFSEQISEVRARKLGIRAFVTKPLSMRVLAETVRQVLDS